MYQPNFTCKHCGKELVPEFSSPVEGVLTLCTCEGARSEWEHNHRMEIERRKRNKRGK